MKILTSKLTTILVIFFLLIIIPKSIAKQADGITIRYFGHSAFMITTSSGMRIITDPVQCKGYEMPAGYTAEVVTISHEHIDHNNITSISTDFVALRGCYFGNQRIVDIDTTINDVRIYNVASFHDPGHHGFNSIFVFEFDGIRVAHLGDLGTVLSEEQVEAMGIIDILFLPVGGQFTISGKEADTVVSQLCQSGIIIPMHFKTEAFNSLPYSAEDYLQGKGNVIRTRGTKIELPLKSVRRETVHYLMKYEN
ncbi:MBL fold metallo-hydrolase [Bacteroidota bacterium]